MQAIGREVPTTPADQWKIAGQSLPKVDGRGLVTGKHRYTSDLKRPGMLYGKVLRPAAFNATLASVDPRAAEALSGVAVVREGNFLGVTAPNEYLAERALAAIQAEWQTTPQPSGAELFEDLKKNATGGSGGTGRARPAPSDADQGLAIAEKKLEATYTVAY